MIKMFTCVGLAYGVAALCSPTHVMGEPLPDQEACTEESGVTVSLELRKLRRGRGGIVGKAAVLIHNGTEQPVALEDPEVHGLVFENIETGELHVLLHPCQCVRDVRNPEEVARIGLEPGQRHEIVLEEFGCAGSMWKAPPRGRYWVTYRLHTADAAHSFAQLQAPDGSPNEQSDWCRMVLQDPMHWEGALISDPVEIRLR
jgi:hypothetical protein